MDGMDGMDGFGDPHELSVGDLAFLFTRNSRADAPAEVGSSVAKLQVPLKSPQAAGRHAWSCRSNRPIVVERC